MWKGLSLSSRLFLDVILFLWKWVRFSLVFRKILRTVSLLIDDGIPVFTITLFLLKSFPSLFASASFVVRYISFVEHAVFPGLPWLLFCNHWVFNILFHMLVNGCFWLLTVWSHIDIFEYDFSAS